MIINYQEAKKIAVSFLSQIEQDINKSIIGNWPIFVSKNGEIPSIR